MINYFRQFSFQRILPDWQIDYQNLNMKQIKRPMKQLSNKSSEEIHKRLKDSLKIFQWMNNRCGKKLCLRSLAASQMFTKQKKIQ